MWHLSSFVSSFAPSKTQQKAKSQPKAWLSLLGGAFIALLPQLAYAQARDSASSSEAAPTVRYARGERVGLAEIVAEWRGYYADVPVYQCVCQADICDQGEGWPYREYDRYQLSVALGPNNGKAAESAGFNCFDIADGSRPANPRSFSAEERNPNEPVAIVPPRIPSPPTPPAARPPAPPTPVVAAAPSPTPADSSTVPKASVVNNGAAIQLDWQSGTSDVIAIAGSNWNLNVLEALDCENLSVVDEKLLAAQRVVGRPAVDSVTGNVAIPVLLDSCVEADQSAVFVIDPNEGGGYALYRSQLPGEQPFPNEFSTYAFSSITGVQYWDGYLLVRQANAAGAEVISVFLPGSTPAGEYGGCGVVRPGEGASNLCKE